MLAILFALVAPPQYPPGYMVRPSSAEEPRVVMVGAGASVGDVVLWDVPPQVQHSITGNGAELCVWVVAEQHGQCVPFWAGEFRGHYVVFPRAGPPRRGEFVLIVR